VHLSWFAHLQLMISEKQDVIEEIRGQTCNQHKKIFRKHVILFGTHNFFVNLLSSEIYNLNFVRSKLLKYIIRSILKIIVYEWFSPTIAPQLFNIKKYFDNQLIRIRSGFSLPISTNLYLTL
jgi:hypothetical protein